MPQFRWQGRSGAGDAVSGLLDAADAGAVATHLFAAGVTPVRIDPAAMRPAAERRPEAAFSWRRKRVQNSDLMLFSRQMHALLKAGVPIVRALGGLQESATNPALAEAIHGVREGLEAGRDLSASMQRAGRVFSPFYVAMIYVGESTGRLDEIFLRLFRHLEFQEFMRAQVKAALRYPSFVIAAMLGAIVVINLFVIPAFAKVYRGFGAKLPVVTQGLIAFSDFMVVAWPWLLAGAVGGVFAWRRFVLTPGGRLWWDRVRLRLPIAGPVVLKATIARFTRSFALAFRSGVPVTQALSLTAQTVGNAHVAHKVEAMRDHVERGESLLRAAVQSQVFTPVALQMIVVGEESGTLDDMMDEVAEMYQREVEIDLKGLSAQIEPILIVGLGILVLILALGVFLPVWDLGQAAFDKGK